MLQGISRWLPYSFMGWEKDVRFTLPDKAIIHLVPHISNYDFLIDQLYASAERLKSNFLMKKEWFFWSLGPIFRELGGTPVWRDKKISMTDRLADYAIKADKFQLCITPKGTRSLDPEWEKGFYYIALTVQLPIYLYELDYERKLIECSKVIKPPGDLEQDMKEIELHFEDFKGKYPELFTIGELNR